VKEREATRESPTQEISHLLWNLKYSSSGKNKIINENKKKIEN
jgi:hypothetical protein